MSEQTYFWILVIVLFGYVLPLVVNGWYFDKDNDTNISSNAIERREGESLIIATMVFMPVFNILVMVVIFANIIGTWKNKRE